MKKFVPLIPVVMGILLSGCSVKYTPVVMETTTPKATWTLTEKVDVPLESGSTTHLKANTTWEYVGTIEQGDVYKTKDQIVTVKGSNMFEAYLVISGERLVGFYLPVENGFTRISKPIEIQRKILN